MNSRTTKRALTKNKKWRKIDNESIDRMTIEKTQEVLEGDVTMKSDDQLFVIDTVVNKNPSLSSKKEKWQNHQLSWEKRIQPNENTVGLKRATPPDLQRKKQQKVKEIKKKVELQQKKPKAPAEPIAYDKKGNPLQVPSDQNGLFDIWDTADDRVVAVQKLKRKNPSGSTEYLEPVLLPPPSKKRKIETPSKIPAVETGPGGTSYRPVYEDHQELLAEAVAEVIKKREEEKRVNNILKTKQKYRKSEMWVDGERVVEEEEEKEVQPNEEEEKEHIAQPFVERKSRAERNKEMRKKEMKKIQIRKEELEKQRKEFEALPQILDDIKEQEESRKEREKYKAKIKHNADYKTKKLGPIPFQADPTAVVLTEELPSKLRQVQPKVDLLRDRYLSLQKRNIIEPRIKRFKTRRYPIQIVEKWSANK